MEQDEVRLSKSLRSTKAIVIVGSALALLAGFPYAFRFFSGTPNPGMGAFGRFLNGGFVVFFFLGLWGLATGIGLYRLHRWARVSMLVFSGLLVVFYGLQVVGLLMLPRGDISVKGEVIVLTVSLALTCPPLLLGIWWLRLFRRPGVKELFQTRAGTRGSGAGK